jgi:hypothetical protein
MRTKSLTIIACITVGIALLAGCGKKQAPVTKVQEPLPKVADYTKLATGKKVILEIDKLTPGTIEAVSWKYFNAVLKKDRKLATSLASKLHKIDINFAPAWKNLQRRYAEPNLAFDQKLFIKIYAKNMKKGDRIKGYCKIYGYSKNEKKEAWVDFNIIFINDTIKIGR